MANMDFTSKDVHDMTVWIVAENLATRLGSRNHISEYVEQSEYIVRSGGNERSHMKRMVEEAVVLAIELLKLMERNGWERGPNAHVGTRWVDTLPMRR